MKEQLQKRLEGLKKEFETGQARLRELETEQTYVRETLLRISGAIQVLEETLAQEAKTDETAKTPDSPEAEPVSEMP
jgi:predicted nuclease with TOPRIM domain